jgi:preprotein translocase subunit SecD
VLKDAVKNGYTSAFTSILDANVTTFIAGSVLWLYGSGPIQNFSVMLIVGTIFSVITSVFITRVFFNIALFCNVRNLL